VGKLRKRMKVPRFARHVEIVINVPEPVPAVQSVPAPTPQPPKPPGWGRAWSVTKVLGPALASVIAIVISVAAFMEQRSADQSQASASQRQEAEQISILQEGGPQASKTVVLIENLGTSPAYSPVISFLIAGYTLTSESRDKPIYVVEEVYVALNPIPACSFATVDFTQAILMQIEDGIGIRAIQPSSEPTMTGQEISSLISMADAESVYFSLNNMNWEYSQALGLAPITSQDYPIASLGYASANYKPATGCT
jgi:hypothetical protein